MEQVGDGEEQSKILTPDAGTEDPPVKRGVAFAEEGVDTDSAEHGGEYARRRPSSRSQKRKPSIFEKIVDPYSLSASGGEKL